MDNVTHSLAGLVTAELAVQYRRHRGDELDPRWASAAWLVSAAAHNAPDLDVLYAWMPGGSLGYMLHHRGHTHTLVFAPLMALISFALVRWWGRRRGASWSRVDWAWLLGLAVLGPFGHLLLDLSNNYGIHPFWPMSDRWIAGDTIFIVEPLFWVATIPAILLATQRRGGRIGWGAALLLAVLAPWVAPFVVWPFALATSLAAAAMLALSMRLGEGSRIVLALAVSLGVVAVFAGSGAIAASRAEAVLATEHPEMRTIDVARAPIPATPACWELVVLQREEGGDRYALRIVRVSAWAPLVPVEDCSRAPRHETTAPLERDGLLRDGVWVEGELVGSVAELRALAERCDVAAFLRFARMPFVTGDPSGDALVLGDLRYDREPGTSFAELSVPRDSPSECPRFVPPWTPWRAGDLLD